MPPASMYDAVGRQLLAQLRERADVGDAGVLEHRQRRRRAQVDPADDRHRALAHQLGGARLRRLGGAPGGAGLDADRTSADAAEVGVDVPHGRLRPPAQVGEGSDGGVLLVEEPDHDRLAGEPAVEPARIRPPRRRHCRRRARTDTATSDAPPTSGKRGTGGSRLPAWTDTPPRRYIIRRRNRAGWSLRRRRLRSLRRSTATWCSCCWGWARAPCTRPSGSGWCSSIGRRGWSTSPTGRWPCSSPTPSSSCARRSACGRRWR